jgi:L-fuconolactonase
VRLLDTHTHVISPDLEKYPRDPLGGKPSKWSIEHPATVEQLVENMEAAGVEKALVVHASTAYGYDDSYAADSVDKYPGKLYGVCSIDFMGENNKEDLQHWVQDRGFVGCRLYTAGILPDQQDWLDDPQTYRAWGWAEETGLPMCVALKPAGFPLIHSLLQRFPKMTMILDSAGHYNMEGGPPYEKGGDLWEFANYPNVFTKVISTTIRRGNGYPGESPAMMRALIDHFGADRIAWGSDFPAYPGTMKSQVELAEAAFEGLTEDEKTWIFGGTAARIYPALA